MQKITIKGQEILATKEMAQAIEVLESTPKGAFATIHDYETRDKKTGEIETISNINFTSRFSYHNYLAKKKALLEEVTFEDLEIKEEKLLALSEDEQQDQFNECVEKMVASIDKTLSGDRSDNHRQASDKFYVNVAPGIKIKLKTMVVGDETFLVKQDGLSVASTIQLSMVERSRKYLQKGEFKKVNSGPKVLMDKAIAKVLKAKKLGQYKTLTLGDNFSTLKIGGMELV